MNKCHKNVNLLLNTSHQNKTIFREKDFRKNGNERIPKKVTYTVKTHKTSFISAKENKKRLKH